MTRHLSLEFVEAAHDSLSRVQRKAAGKDRKLSQHRSLRVEQGFGLCVLGLCRTKHEAFETPASMVKDGLRMLVEAHMQSFNPVLLAHLAAAACAAGRHSEANELMERLSREDRNPEHWCTPEILRVRAVIAVAAADEQAAEQLLQESLAMAAKQGALAWQLKSATELAKLLLAQRRAADARRVLTPIYGAITEGFDVVDVRAAKQMLDDLGSVAPR